ncbi:MAG: glycosyltransferase family 4 protein [Candidatus Omnitrophota bacterium]
MLVRRIKIIHFIWIVSPQLDYSVMKFLQFMGCNVIYTAHNPFPHERGDEHIKKYARIYQTVDHIIALTEYTKQKIVECAGVGEVKISVIPHGDYAPLFSTYKINDDLVGALKKKAAGRKVISFLGLIRPYKGLDFFIEAIDLIKMEMPNSFFVIAGASLITDKEKLRRRLETPITNNDLWADIRFIPNENFVAYLSVTDVLVQPYLNASQSGNTVMAYSAGIPVVSTDVGGLAEMTADDKTGYIVPPGNSAAIAEAVIKCFSRDNYQRLSDNARKAATEKYGWSKIADQTLSIYRNLENRDARA